MRRDFLEFLSECNNGGFANDCGEAMEELVKAVRETGKAGSLTLTIKVVPDGNDTAVVATSSKLNKPRRSRPASVFFVHKDSLHAENPSQLKMFEGGKVHAIEDSPKKVREFTDV